MKKYINSIICLTLFLITFTGCKVEEGEYPGHDGAPSVVLYQYTPDETKYNVDNDLILRVAANSVVENVYYLAQKEDERNAKLEELGEEAFMAYVIEHGTKIEKSTDLNSDVVITGLKGQNIITVVATAGNNKFKAETSFMGIDWENLGTGAYTSILLNQKISTPVLKATHAEWYKLPGFANLIIKVDEGGNAKVETTPLFDHPDYGTVYGNTIDGTPSGGIKEGFVIYLNMYYFVPGLGSFGTFPDLLELPQK